MPILGSRTLVACSFALALGMPHGVDARVLAATSIGAKDPVSAKAAAKDPKPVPEPTVEPTPKPEPTPVADDGPQLQGRVFVEAKGLNDDGGAVLAGRANRAADEAIVAAGVEPTSAAAGPELRIVIWPRDEGGYRVEYEIVYDGSPVEDGTGSSECQLCSDQELIEHIRSLASDASPRLTVPRQPPDTPPPVEPDPPQGPEEPPIETPAPWGAMGKTGLALVIVGVVATGAGIGLGIRQPQHFDDPTRATELTTTRPVGWALLGGGVAVAVTGGILLGLDRRRARAEAAPPEHATATPKVEAALHPWFGPGSGGVGLRGRF